MTAVEITNVAKEVSPNAGLKIVQVWTAVGSSTNETKIDLDSFGIKTLYNVICQVHTTDNSVIVTEAATCSASSGVLTVTIPSGNDSKKRSILIVGA
jgi:hypothetical protein